MKSLVKLFAVPMIAGVLMLTSNVNANSNTDTSIKTTTVQSQDGPSKFSVVLRPSVKQERVKLFLTKASGQRLSVRLSAPDGTPLMTFLTEKKKESVYRNLNFTDAEEGVYKLSVTDGKETVVREIVYKRQQTIVEPSLVIK